MSLSLSDRWQGLKFVLGRLLGISILGLLVSLVGIPFHISGRVINLIFGLFLLGLGVSVGLKSQHKIPQRKFSHAGFGLGLFRGFLNPGRKIISLFPLLWGVRVSEGLAISLAYALSSSVYLLIGFFSAEILNKISKYQKQIKIIGAIILILLGIFYVFKA
jgi:threonine/homoserine/homoserine lactone efflux protein